ncbi:MAG: carboxypeptidase-like regulatory domain-containing protein [Candidatus Neomarinimicrobiota bacterium]|nr:carboxypeptidase-like regulatory domain-containing protein [Candidatus Neomarinimicrobiota bacterium]
MANKMNFKNTVIGLLVAVLATTLFAQKPRDISGTVVGVDGKNVAKTTVILMASDGTEVKRVETSRRGKFSFKKVSPGNYTLQVDAGEKGRLDVPAEVSEENLKLGDIQLAVDAEDEGSSTPDENSYDPTLSQASSNALTDDPMMGSSEPDTTGNQGQDQEFIPDPGKDYILNELSFEIKKMTAELKYLNEELENLKALSKMWVNPLAIYSKEIIMKYGSTVFGKIVYQDETSLKVETLVGYLIVNRKDVVRIVDNVVTEEQAEYVPEQVRDSYTPPPMPKLAEPKYTSPERDQTGKYAANCVLMGNISEKKDAQGNIVFNGEIKNIGGRRADFVKVDFVFRKNWSGETKTLTTFIRGGYHTFDSGITTDATLLPGATGAFELYVPHDFGSFIGYSYVIDWEEYE